LPYNQYTLSRLVAEVSDLIDDPGNVYWTAEEVQLAIIEGLREWSGTTSYWKDRAVINAAVGTTWYDLSALLPTLRPRTVTLGQIVREIQYHVCETTNGVSGVGMTSQFTITEILQAVNRARNRFVMDAILPISIDPNLPSGSAPDGRVTLDPSIVYLHRASWQDSNRIHHTLNRQDAFTGDGYDPLWTIKPGIPFAFSQTELEPLSIQLYPPPIASGTLDMLTVKSVDMALLDSTVLGIPDDFCHAIKYSALADLLSMDGEQANPTVAAYAEQRYSAIVQAALQHKSVIRVMLNGIPLPLVSLFSIDRASPYWRNKLGKPNLAACLYDILALAPVANVPYSLTLDVIQSAPIPALNDYIQLGPEEIVALTNYAQHYLSVKMGGNELASTYDDYNDFQKLVGRRNAALATTSRYLTTLYGQSRREQDMRPDLIQSNA
jgi:hypothetical protein